MGEPKGRFVWYDLMAKDVEGAKRFYTNAIGWKLTKWEGPMDYTMWTVGEQTVGGVMALPEEASKMGAPPHWLGYAATDDVDATCAKAKSLGGKVLSPGTDIPNVGRFAILADPQGAVFAVFRAQGDMPVLSGDHPGAFSWAELNTTDYESAWKFYSGLLGWQHSGDWDMGQGAGKYLMFKTPGAEGSMGGMSNMATQMKAPPHWVYYITVADLEGTLQRVQGGGGKLLNGPMDLPGGGRIAHFMDPQGAAFALYVETRG
jgi:predicted enzyme related to lactoylglutathione lyase